MDSTVTKPRLAVRTWDEAGLDEWQEGRTVLSGCYSIEAVVSGGMGRVFHVRDVYRNELDYAVKRVKILTPENRRLFLRELVTWLGLPEHPYLVPARFFRIDGDEILIFADWIEGSSLKSAIAREAANTIEEILDIAIQIAWGLHALHALGSIHQDVKSDNILLTYGNHVRVTDFGIVGATRTGRPSVKRSGTNPVSSTSDEQEPSLEAGRVGGTAAYMSPEQLLAIDLYERRLFGSIDKATYSKQYPKISLRVDIYGWAAVVVEMLYGRRTWQLGSQILKKLHAHKRGDHPGNLDLEIPLQLRNLLEECLANDDGQRPQDMLSVAKRAVEIYGANISTYKRQLPNFPSSSDLDEGQNERETNHGARWDDPQIYFDKVIEAGICDSNALQAELPESRGTRRTQSICDLAWYTELTQLLYSAIESSNQMLDVYLKSSLNKALLSEHLGDTLGAIATLDHNVQLCKQSSHAGLQSQLGLNYNTLGAFLININRYEEANSCIDQAIAIYRKLSESGAIEARSALGVAHHNKARLLERNGSLEDATRCYDRAFATFVELRAAGNRSYDYLLAAACRGKADTQCLLRRFDDAISSYDLSIKIYDRVVTGGRFEFGPHLVEVYRGKAGALQDSGRGFEASKIYQYLIKSLDKLAASGRLDIVKLLASTLVDYSVVLEKLKMHELMADTIIGNYDRAITVLEWLVAHGYFGEEETLARSYANRGNTLAGLHRTHEALESYARANQIHTSLIAYGRTDLLRDLAATKNLEGILLEHAGLADKAKEAFRIGVDSYRRMMSCGLIEPADRLLETVVAKARAILEAANELTGLHFLSSWFPEIQRDAASQKKPEVMLMCESIESVLRRNGLL